MGTLFRPWLVLRDFTALFPTLRYFLGRSGSAIVIAGRCDWAIRERYLTQFKLALLWEYSFSYDNYCFVYEEYALFKIFSVQWHPKIPFYGQFHDFFQECPVLRTPQYHWAESNIMVNRLQLRAIVFVFTPLYFQNLIYRNRSVPIYIKGILHRLACMPPGNNLGSIAHTLQIC